MSSLPNYRGYRFPPEIISHAVWLYHRFTLSLRDIEDLLAERDVIVSYESIRHWCTTFGLDYARRLRKRRGPIGDRWFLDEVTVSIQGKRQYLWRAVDQDGDLLDILVQSRKDKRAAKRVKEAGLSRTCTPRDLRRAFVTTLLDRGNDVAVVSRFAGHASVATTIIYNRRSIDEERKAQESMHLPYTGRHTKTASESC
jgi:transposase-like protein